MNQYSHPKWRKKREVILRRDKWNCIVCESGRDLHIHHDYYVSGRKIWDYPNFSLSTLCGKCHKDRHYEQRIADDKEGRSIFFEWEIELERIFKSNPRGAGDFWFLAASISDVSGGGLKRAVEELMAFVKIKKEDVK